MDSYKFAIILDIIHRGLIKAFKKSPEEPAKSKPTPKSPNTDKGKPTT